MLPQASDFAAASRVSLGRLNLETRIPHAQAAQSGPAGDPSRAFAKDFATALGEMLAPVCDAGDPSVWIIRRLDFDLAGGKVWEPGRIAGALAGEMRKALLRVFSGESSDLAVRFPDRAAYLAQFLSDLVDGSARDRWYFAAFRHLDAMPAGVAACMVLEAEPDHAFGALVAMERRGRLPRFLGGLSDREAARILRPLGEGSAVEPPFQAMIAVCELLLKRTTAVRIPLTAKMRLELLAGIGDATSLPPDIILAALDAVIARIGAASSQGLEARAIPDMPLEEAFLELPETVQPAEKRLAALVARLAGRMDPGRKRTGTNRIATQGIVTPRAGVFLLWRSVMDLGLDAILTAGCGAAQAKAWRHQLAVALSGPAQADAAADEALHWLTRHEPGGSEIDPIPVSEAAALQKTLFRTLTGLRPARALHLAMQRENGVTVLQDAVTQDWYFACGDGRAPTLPEADIASILVPTDMAAELCAAWPGWTPAPLPAASHVLLTQGPPDDATLARAIRAAEDLRPAGPDLAYLAGADGFSDTGLAMMLYARAAYADIGRRLPGLTLSSAAYLGRNAIHGVGRLRENAPGEEADAEIDLPSVPFDFIWRMTGMDGAVFRLADGRSIRLNMARAAP